MGVTVLSTGCVGVIKGDESTETSDPTDPGADAPGPEDPGPGGDDPSPGGDDPSPGGDDPVPPSWSPPPLAADAPDTPSARLRAVEYRNTVAQVFGLNRSALDDVQLATDGSDDRIFQTNSVEVIGDFRVYIDAAQELSDEIAAQLVGSCEWSAQTTACVQSELRPRIERMFRGSVSDAYLQELGRVFSEIRGTEAPEQIALGAILYSILVDERFLFHREQGVVSDATATTVTDLELASRLSYLMTDAPPDEALLSTAQAGQLKAQLAAQIRRLYATDAADDMIWRFVAGWLSLPLEQPPMPQAPPPGDECNFTSECQAIHGPQATDCVNSQSNMSWCACGAGVRCAPLPEPPASLEASAWEETRRFVTHIFKSDTIPLSELFSAKYSFIDGTLAEHYGVPAPTQDWQRYDFPDSAQRTGILSHASFLTSNSSHERDVSWIFRGKALYERLFCGELGLPMEGVIGEEVEDRQNHPFCGTCHSIMDPLGKLFDAYDETGRYIGTDFTTLPVLAFSDIDGDYPGLAAFMANIENSRAFEHCFVKMWFRFVFGRVPSTVDEQSYDEALAALTAGKTAKGAMIKLLEAQAFQALYRAPDRRVCQ